jgi:hypothetical protein
MQVQLEVSTSTVVGQQPYIHTSIIDSDCWKTRISGTDIAQLYPIYLHVVVKQQPTERFCPETAGTLPKRQRAMGENTA